MLRRLRLVDFKSFTDEAVEFAPLTLLVGANASGKSNSLDALRFLHQTYFDQGVVEILDGEQRPGAVPNAWQGLRGGSKEASRIGAESFLIDSTWDIPEMPELDVARPMSAMHRIRCAAATDNFPSLRVIQRLGFRFEGIARQAELVASRWLDHAVFAKLSSDE